MVGQLCLEGHERIHNSVLEKVRKSRGGTQLTAPQNAGVIIKLPTGAAVMSPTADRSAVGQEPPLAEATWVTLKPS